MVSLISLIGGNVRDDKVGDDKVISTAMEACSGDIGDGKDVVYKGGDVGDNGGMTCGAEISTDVQVCGGMEVSGANMGVGDNGGNVSSGVPRPPLPSQPQPH